MAIPKQNVCTHEIGQRIPVMVENALRWPMVGGTYLEVIGCLGAALVNLLCGEIDFNTADGFGDWVDFSTRECEGLGGGGGRGAERTNGFKQVLPSDVNT